MEYRRGVVARSFLWRLLEKFSVQGLSLFITFLLARILAPSDYGTIAIVAVFTTLSIVIIDGGLSTALVQKKGADDVDFSTIFWGSLVFSFFIYCLLFIAAPFISDFYNNSILTLVVRVLSIGIFFQAMNSVQRAYVAKNMLFKKLFYSSILALVLSGAVGLYMAINDYGVWALVCLHLCSTIVTTLVMFLTIRWLPYMKFSLTRFKSLFSYGWKILGINLIVEFYGATRSLIIGKYYSPSSLAFYDRGCSLPQMLVTNISSSIQTVIFPAFSDAQDDINKVKHLVRRSVSLTSFLMYPLLVIICSISKPLILLLLTEKWLPALPFVWIFSVAYMIVVIQTSSVEAIKAIGKSRFSLTFETTKVVIGIVVLFITAFYGVIVIAIGTIVCYLLYFLMNIYPNKLFLNYDIWEQLHDILYPLLFSIFMGGVIYPIQLLYFPPLITIIIQVFLGIAVYFMLCHFFKQQSYIYIIGIVKDKIKTIHSKSVETRDESTVF